MPWSTPKASSKARGYGHDHVKARADAAKRHHPNHPCARCGHPLGPMGPWLHYDHNPQRTGYLGFSHGLKPCPICRRRCNIRAGAQVAARRANKIRKLTRKYNNRW